MQTLHLDDISLFTALTIQSLTYHSNKKDAYLAISVEMSEENDPWCYRDAEGSDSKDDTTSDSHRRSRVKTHSGPNLSAIEPRCGHNVTLPPEAEGISASTDVTFQNSSTAADTIEETVNHPKMVQFEDIPCPKLQLLVRQCSGGISKNRVNSIYLCPLEELLSAADGDVDHAMWLSEHVRAFVKNRIPPQEQEHQHPDRKALFGVKAKMLRKAAKVLRLCHWEIPKAVAYWEILSDEKLNLPASDRDAEKQRMRERFNGRSE